MKKQRAFLKWAGGKYGLIEDIQRHLPQANKLIEPFVGAGSVFLNTDYDEYLLADINKDLINIYNLLKSEPEKYIKESQRLFKPECNRKEFYLDIRAQFNASDDVWFRSIAFLYMNRFGFNGLCRYNKKGGFNVPFGSYKKPYFPEKELINFAEKAKKATFVCESYTETFARADSDSVIYCDPPYAPLSNTANFTSYAGNGFTLDDQATLAELSEKIANSKGIPVLISNHDTAHTRRLYKGAALDTIQVKRTISRNGSGRNKVDELFALFSPQQPFTPNQAPQETKHLSAVREALEHVQSPNRDQISSETIKSDKTIADKTISDKTIADKTESKKPYVAKRPFKAEIELRRRVGRK